MRAATYRRRIAFVVPFIRQNRYRQHCCRANSHIIGNLAQGLLLVNDPMLVFNATGRGDALLAPLSGVRERALGEELVCTVLRIGGAGVSVLRSPAPD